jgi:hypothetical protein
MLYLRLITILLFLICGASEAALFGASNYEECMSDGKVGRTNAELRLLTDKCRKEFPALPKLYALKDSRFSCVDNVTTTKDEYKVVKNNMYRVNMHRAKKLLATRTKEKITSIEDVHNTGTGKDMKGLLTINTLDGTASFYIEDVNFSASLNCTEN